MTKTLNVIVAMDSQNGIGQRNAIPWKIPQDMAYFKKTTCQTEPNKQNAVIMGRKTWDSLPNNYRPLPSRKNIVLSRSQTIPLTKSVTVFSNFDACITTTLKDPSIHHTFVIGGAEIYALTLQHIHCKTLYITRIDANCQCDTFFPTIPPIFSLKTTSPTQTEGPYTFRFEVWTRE